jgi:hypothetical protein
MAWIESQGLIAMGFTRLSSWRRGVIAEKIIFLDFMAVRMSDESEISICCQQGCPSERRSAFLSALMIGTPSLTEEGWGFLSTRSQQKDHMP